ncbi:unnamed protein product, partial [Musa hybrid cultivar]
MQKLPPVSVSVAASVNVDSTVLLKLPPCLEGGGTHLVFIHCPPGVLPPAVLEGKVAPSHHHLAPVDDGLDGFLPSVQKPRTGADRSIH